MKIKEYKKLLYILNRELKLNYKKSYKKVEESLLDIFNRVESIGELNEIELNRLLKNNLIQIRLGSINHELNSDIKAVINTYLSDVYSKTSDDIDKQLKTLNVPTITSKVTADDVINQSIAGHVWTERIDKHSSDLAYSVIGEVTQSFKDGDTFTTMANKVKKHYNVNYGRAIMIARTEGHRVQETSKYLRMKEVSKQLPMVKTWNTVRDERVRSTHADMDGVTIPFDDEFILPSGASCLRPSESGDPAEDINCRCFLTFGPVEYNELTLYNKNERFIQHQLDVIDKDTNEKYFIPQGTIFKYVNVIAKDNEIRELEGLIREFGSGTWEKTVGLIITDKYKIDVHWYENKNKQYKVKVKMRKEIKDGKKVY